MLGYHSLGIPDSTSIVNVTAFDVLATTSTFFAPASALVLPVLPGRDNIPLSDFAYLIHNESANKTIMFDLGIRKDPETYSPFVQEEIKNLPIDYNITKDSIDYINETGTALEAINAVIWSHTHFDHIGHMDRFPSSTDLVIGEGTVRDIFNPVTNPNGSLTESDFANRTVTELNFTRDSTFKIGGFQALDYFDDGSFYLINLPGHQPGHTGALARVTPTSFVFISGDSAHHVGQIRPTRELQRTTPCPAELLEAARHDISTAFFTSGGNDSTGFDLAARSGPFLSNPEVGFDADPATTRISQDKLHPFDANEDILVIVSHDITLSSFIGAAPVSLNDWKEVGVKGNATWQFVNASSPAFRLGPA